MSLGMFDSFITGHWFDDPAKQLWSDGAQLQAWLDVESSLAAVQAELGLIPPAAAATIARCADARHFDLAALSREIAFAQHPLTPVLHRFEALCGEPAAGFLHWGATTQNIFDTATALLMQRTHRLLADHLVAAIQALGQLALRHSDTPMAGRTHGQQALPISLGYKLAPVRRTRWLARQWRRTATSRAERRRVGDATCASGGTTGPGSASSSRSGAGASSRIASSSSRRRR